MMIIKNKILIISALTAIILSGCCSFSGSSYTGPVSDHFDGKQFHNQEGSEDKSLWDLLWWQMTRSKGEWNSWTDIKPSPKPTLRVGPGELKATWVNHSTVLLQFDNLNVLTDPIWTDMMSPVEYIGPHRRRPPAVKIEDLPPIDIVLISHNHYDHMDLETMENLKQKFDPFFIVPLGNKQFLTDNNFQKVFEFDWWQDTVISGIKVNMVPARHFSNRGLCDRNTTLWCGYVIETSKGPVYFAGDTGFGKHFSQIFNKFGPMRFSMISIGAFKPRWFMSSIHLSPEEAVEAHIILQSQKTIGIHYSTFAQADDGEYDSIIELEKAMKSKKVEAEKFIPLYPGITLDVK